MEKFDKSFFMIQECQSLIGYQYVHDVFFIWTDGGTIRLSSFLKDYNSNLKFTYGLRRE